MLRIVRILPILALIVLLLFIHRLSHLLEHLLLLVLVLHLLVMVHLLMLLLLLLHHGIIIYLIFFNWRIDLVNGRAVNGVVSIMLYYVSCFGGRELFLFDDFRWRGVHLSKRVWTLLKTLLFAQSFFSFFLTFGR